MESANILGMGGLIHFLETRFEAENSWLLLFTIATQLVPCFKSIVSSPPTLTTTRKGSFDLLFSLHYPVYKMVSSFKDFYMEAFTFIVWTITPNQQLECSPDHVILHVILHVRTNNLISELNVNEIADLVINPALSVEREDSEISVSRLVSCNDNFINKSSEVKGCLFAMCNEKGTTFIDHTGNNKPDWYLNRSKLHFNGFSTIGFAIKPFLIFQGISIDCKSFISVISDDLSVFWMNTAVP